MLGPWGKGCEERRQGDIVWWRGGWEGEERLREGGGGICVYVTVHIWKGGSEGRCVYYDI